MALGEAKIGVTLYIPKEQVHVVVPKISWLNQVPCWQSSKMITKIIV
jgi:hypothetical protein